MPEIQSKQYPEVRHASREGAACNYLIIKPTRTLKFADLTS